MDGMILSMLIARIRELSVPIDQSLLLHNLHESFSVGGKEKTRKGISQNLKTIKSSLSPKISEINRQISLINKMLKGLDFVHKIPKLKTTDILSIVDKRLKSIFEIKDAQRLGNDHFHKLLEDVLYRPIKSIQDFQKIIENETYSDELKSLPEPLRFGFGQALDVCSIGYYTTSVFIASRTVEGLINTYYQKLFDTKKLDKFDLSKMTFENKINKLNSLKYLSDNLYHGLSGIRIDRNKFGHPSSKILSKRQAHLKIRTMMELSPEVEKRIQRIR